MVTSKIPIYQRKPLPFDIEYENIIREFEDICWLQGDKEFDSDNSEIQSDEEYYSDDSEIDIDIDIDSASEVMELSNEDDWREISSTNEEDAGNEERMTHFIYMEFDQIHHIDLRFDLSFKLKYNCWMPCIPEDVEEAHN